MANQRLNATVQIGSVLERSVKKNIGILRSGLEGVGDEIKTITDRQKEMSKQRKVLEKQGRSVADLDREYEQLGRQLDTLKRKQAAWTRAAQASARVGQDFRRMTGNITRVARNASVAVGLVGTAIFTLASSTASLGDDVAKTADKLGVGIEALQELRYAAERSGVPIATFDSSMGAFVKRLGEAKEGTGPAADAIKKLGLNVSDLLEMKPEDALGEIAEKLKDVENPAERAAIVSDLFSRAGLGLINMLKDGKKGLDDYADAARDTGYVLSEETARDAEKFQDRLLDAQLTVKGLKNVIGAEFMPVVQRAMETFTDWAKTNREDVKAFAEQVVTSLERAAPVIGEIASGFGEVASTVGSVTAKVADMVGGWDNFAIVVGGIMAGKAIASIGSFALSVGRLGWAMWGLVPALPIVAAGIKAVGLALLANPIGLAIAAIAGGAALIYKEWDSIGPWFNRQLGNVGDIFTGFANLVGGVVTGDMGTAVDGLKTMWTGFKEYWKGTTEAIVGAITYAYDNGIKPVMDALGVTEPIERAWQSLMAGLGSVMESIGEKFVWLWEKVKPVVEALQWVGTKAGAALREVGIGGPGSVMDNPDAVSRAQSSTGSGGYNEWRSGLPGGVVGSSVTDQFRGPQKRATGGSFMPGGLLVGEGGRELRFESRGGFIANNRATERLAALASSARSNIERAAGAMAGAGAGGGSVVNHISINAAGMSPQAILDELERRLRDSQSGSLYDAPRGYGQYGGVV